jgi:mRNA interferase MazF
VIIQDDRFDTNSVTLCAFTTNLIDAPLLRPLVEPSNGNGLTMRSRLMADKVMTVPRTKLGRRVGHLGDDDMTRLNNAIILFLGLAG